MLMLAWPPAPLHQLPLWNSGVESALSWMKVLALCPYWLGADKGKWEAQRELVVLVLVSWGAGAPLPVWGGPTRPVPAQGAAPGL